MRTIQDALKKISLFSDLTDDMIVHLSGEVHERQLSAGEILFHEGDKGDSLFFVLEGTLEITQIAGQDREIVLATFKAGDYFGEMALLDDKPRSASARAASDSRLLALDREDFATLLEKNPAIAIKLTRAISERLRKTTPFKTRIIPAQVTETTQQETPGVRVFISYSRKDKLFVQKLHDAIRTHGLDVWVDWENIPLTADWWAEIQRGIENADTFAFVISPDSLQSRICGDEIQVAINHNKRLIPILHRDPEKADPIHPAVGATNWVFMRSDEDITNNLPEMLRIVNTDLDWLQDHTRLQMRAGEWTRSGRDSSFLLRGIDLENAKNWLTKAESVPDPKPTPLHIEYINASVLEAQNARLATRRQRIFLGSISFAFLITLVMTIIAGFSYVRAEDNRQNAEQNLQIAETAKSAAEFNEGFAQVQRSTAEVASTQAIFQQQLAVEQQQLALNEANAASTARVEAENQKAEADAQREIADVQRATAQAAQEDALVQRDLALSRQRAAQALSFLDTQPDLAALLSLESYKTSDTLEAKNALLTVLQRGLSRQIIPVTPLVPIQLTPLYSVALGSDGIHLAFGGENGTLVIWNYAEGKSEYAFTAHGGKVIWSLAFSPDGSRLASAGDDGNVILWDVATGQQIKQFFAGNVALSVAWSPDNHQVATVTGARVVVWDVETGTKKEKSLSFGLNELAWSPNGLKLAVASKNDLVYVLNSTTLATEGTLSGHTGDIQSVAWGPDSNLLASASDDKTVRLWNVQESQELAVLKGHLAQVLSVSISYDGKILASSGADRQVILWDVETHDPITTLKVYKNEILSVALIPRAGDVILAAASRDKTVGLFEVITEQRLNKNLAAGLGSIFNLGLSSEGTPLVLTTQKRNELSIYQIANENDLLNKIPTTGEIRSAALSRDGTRLAIGFADGRISIRNLQTAETFELTQENAADSLAFSFDDQMLASSLCTTFQEDASSSLCESSEIRLWDLDQQVTVQPLTGQPGTVLSIAFSEDGTRLASGSSESAIWMWNLSNSQPIGLPLTRHQAAVTSLAFSPDGTTLASGSENNAIILWDLSTNQPVGEPLAGSTGVVTGLVFGTNGKVLFSTGLDGTLYQWEVDLQLWQELACSLAGRNFSQNEWTQLFIGEPYEITCPQWDAGE